MSKIIVSSKLSMATILLSFFLSFIACSKDDDNNSTAVSNLIDTLKARNPSCVCEPYLNKYLWHSKVVYLLGFKGPACNWRPAYYDIKAEEFNLPADYNYERFIKEASFLNNEWTCQ